MYIYISDIYIQNKRIDVHVYTWNTLYYVSSSRMLWALFSEYVMIQWSIIARYKIQVATIDPDYVTSNVWELILWWEYECALSEAGRHRNQCEHRIFQMQPSVFFYLQCSFVLMMFVLSCLHQRFLFRHPCPEIFMIGMVVVLHSRSSNHGALIFPS